MTPHNIISEAIARYKPVKFLLMVSGGHDSVTNAHVSAGVLTGMGIPFEVYHGDTTIGIPQTQEYVKMICALYGWKLNIRRPPLEIDWYDHIVAKFGFPGPTKTSHQFMYRRLKERALRHFVTYECKSEPRKRENVLLLSGVRQQESRIRMGYSDPISKERSKIWANPIFYYSEEDCTSHMVSNAIPRNPVKDKICISGECLCGAFAKIEEWVEIKKEYPEVAARIEALWEIAKANGFPWHWASGPIEWKKGLKSAKATQSFMCVNCETNKKFLDE